MVEKPPRGLFVVGTDTGVGKTHVTAAIARAARARGWHVGVYKPAESGWTDPSDPASDAVRLWEAASRPAPIERVCPQRFEAPLAPHLAARSAGRELDERLLTEGLSWWTGRCNLMLVEGAGGLLSPITDERYVADLALEFGYPVLVVGANRVGVIHQVLQTLIAASTIREGLDVIGVILSQVDSREDPSRATNATEIARRIVPPVLGVLEYGVETIELSESFWQSL